MSVHISRVTYWLASGSMLVALLAALLRSELWISMLVAVPAFIFGRMQGHIDVWKANK